MLAAGFEPATCPLTVVTFVSPARPAELSNSNQAQTCTAPLARHREAALSAVAIQKQHQRLNPGLLDCFALLAMTKRPGRHVVSEEIGALPVSGPAFPRSKGNLQTPARPAGCNPKRRGHVMPKDGEHPAMLAGLPARPPAVEDNPQAPARAGFLHVSAVRSCDRRKAKIRCSHLSYRLCGLAGLKTRDPRTGDNL